MYDLFAGVKVVEVAQWVMVPTAGAILVDWGADVIKIEHPVKGDALRGLANRMDHTPGVNPIDRPWMEFSNRGKRDIGLDISTPDGREILYRLVDEADVFLTNWLPGAQERMGITSKDIQGRNPRIVYASGTAWGSRGAKAGQPGYDLAQSWAAGGMCYQITDPEADEPVFQPSAVGDSTGGMALAGGIAAALYAREKTGKGACVEVSLYNIGMWFLGQLLSGAANAPAPPPVISRKDKANPLTIAYRTRDNRWLWLVLTQPDRWWTELCRYLGHPELAEDPRFKDITTRKDNKDACRAELDAIFAEKTLAEWSEILETFEGAWAPVSSPSEIVVDPQVEANGYLAVAKGHGEDVKVVSSPMVFNGEPLGDLRAMSEFGEDTENVLLDHGYTWEGILDLKERGVIV